MVTTDVLVINGSSAGVAAAIGAAEDGYSVAIIEPTRRLGGMITNGVSTDLHRDWTAGVVYKRFQNRIYRQMQLRGLLDESKNGKFYSPDDAEYEIRKLVSEHPNIKVYYDRQLTDVVMNRKSIDYVKTSWGWFKADWYVDATPAGDVLVKTGIRNVDYRLGRESSASYLEPPAPITPDDPDTLMQAYTYRLTLEPGGYLPARPADYYDNLPLYRAVQPDNKYECTIDGVRYANMRLQRCLPGGKLDLNIDKVGINHDYVLANQARRDQIAAEHRNFVIGYVHYLNQTRGYNLGLSRSDYTNNGYFPERLYVREGARLIGKKTLTYHNMVKGSTQNTWPGSIALGEYGMDSHDVTGTVSGHPDNTGGFWLPTDVYEIPYEIMVSNRYDNVIWPMAVSATHVAYGSLRIEPVRMAMGYAAGRSFRIADDMDRPIHWHNIAKLRRRLQAAGQAVDK